MSTTSKRYLILLYDNTLNGLLSAIFDVYRLQLDDFDIKPQKDFQETLFQPTLNVATNKAKANRIKIGLKRKTKQNLLPHLAHYFNTASQKEQVIYRFIHQTFQPSSFVKSYHIINT